ncbi:MAG: cupin domain-containing protein [Saprospiraceae bacterium]
MKMEEDPLKESFGTLSQTINGLIKLGYTRDFNIRNGCLVCDQLDIPLSQNDFQIDKVYRFEGVSNPDDQSILYAISSLKSDIKGTLVNGYGISADENVDKLVEQLKTNKATVFSENSSLDATEQRPEGSRILNAELVEMDLEKFINQIKNESTWAGSDRNSLTIFKSQTMRIVLMGLHENAELKPHKANGVISVQVLQGQIDFNTEQQTTVLNKGQMIALRENTTHSVYANAESFFLLTLAMNNK